MPIVAESKITDGIDSMPNPRCYRQLFLHARKVVFIPSRIEPKRHEAIQAMIVLRGKLI